MTAGMTACGGKGEEPAPADTPAAKPAESEAPAADAGGSDSEQAGEEDFSILEGKTISFMTSQAKFFDAYNTMAEAIKADYGCEVEFQVIPDEEYDSLIKVKLSTSEVRCV